MRDIITMRDVAQHIDARNRVIPAETGGYAGYRAWPDPEGRARGDYDGPDVCRIEGCGNLLTVSDPGNICRQCTIFPGWHLHK